MHCVPLTEMTYAANLLNWGFAMDGRVAPVGALARPVPAAIATTRGRTAAPAEIGALLLAALTAGGIAVLLRRRAGGGTPPGP